MLVYTTGNGVHGFTLDPSIGEFILSHSHLRIPTPGQPYKRYGMKPEKVVRVALNIPPASAWRYGRDEAAKRLAAE